MKRAASDWSEISVLIPGNHDDRGALRQVFDQVCGQGDEDVWFLCEVGDWRLIGLDTRIPGEVAGKLSGQTIDRLDGWLQDDSARPTVIFMHHPPAPIGSPWIDRIGLNNPEPLRVAISRAPGVKGIFCGHVHQAFDGEFAGARLHAAPATSFQFLPKTAEFELDRVPPGFRCIRLDGDRFETEVVRLPLLRYRPGQARA